MKKVVLILVCLWPLFGGFRAPQKELPKVKNIILMIGDGMGVSQLTAGLIVKGKSLEIERIKHVGLIKTFSEDNLITDSAAGATAFATGKKTFNGALAIDPFSRRPIPTILETAHHRGLSTGLLVTSYIQHATPAAFFAHQPNRSLYEEITEDLLEGVVDIAIGGGRRFFENRKDGKSLLDSIPARGYEYFKNIRKAEKQAATNRMIILEDNDHLPSIAGGRGKFLMNAAEFVTERLNQNKEGFFLMIEASQIDWGGHANDKDYIANEVVDFDRTIGKVLDFAEADGNTLVVITADHETGGFAIEDGSLINREIVCDFTTGGHSAAMVPVFAYGPGAEIFGGIYDNTDIYKKMIALYGWEDID